MCLGGGYLYSIHCIYIILTSDLSMCLFKGLNERGGVFFGGWGGGGGDSYREGP